MVLVRDSALVRVRTRERICDLVQSVQVWPATQREGHAASSHTLVCRDRKVDSNDS